MHLSELKQKSIKDLASLASDHHIDGAGAMRRQELVFALLRSQADQGGHIVAAGVLEILPDGFRFLRAADNNYLPGPEDVYVSPSQIRRFGLHTGDTVSGQVRPPKESERYFALLRVEHVNGAEPEGQRTKRPFEELTATYPNEVFHLAGDGVSSKIIDALCPIGKGQRCLVASPPRAGRTSLLQEIAQAIEANHADVDVLVLLVDERPEDVTEMKRAIKSEVISSTFDEPPARHIQVAEIVVEKAKRMAETGRDVVLLIDSISSMARAYTDVDPTATHEAKRAFGAARKLEEGGSLTIIATALVESGSPADEAAFDQLRGTANCEIRLDAGLRDQQVYPCVDVRRSITHKQERLLDRAALDRAKALRAAVADLDTADALNAVIARL